MHFLVLWAWPTTLSIRNGGDVKKKRKASHESNGGNQVRHSTQDSEEGMKKKKHKATLDLNSNASHLVIPWISMPDGYTRYVPERLMEVAAGALTRGTLPDNDYNCGTTDCWKCSVPEKNSGGGFGRYSAPGSVQTTVVKAV
ncbi:hypothetical protein SCHPADRAFT_897333 [Schizopora paradoxa]|uniref:Uncharacterized protein n=1 Tax=Schizopora paradoxa TaxID=27342 RepID=A0A0H2RGJ0_9AGAM|nr:hypothetical protein SCHPADRAFT_897333 [Schizopora paradoxa]